ncbi:PEBP-like protein [Rhizopogon salebrosus TDB-379]|nr:PEBP-like protein [Rhizopogon salebrosus TDB-379]
MPLLDPLTAVRTALTDAGVIPDVIPADPPFIPKALLVVTFPTGQEALLGNTLTKADAADEPTVAFTPMQVPDVSEPTYTLVMTDPDAPSRKDPKFGQWRHWVTTGVKAPPISTFETGDLAAQLTKPAVTPYYPPAPPKGTGPHRYVFLLYQEPSSDFSIPANAPERKTEPADRRNWNAAKFADEYGLKLVAVNFFYVNGEE